MDPLTALVVATPVFGLALTPPSLPQPAVMSPSGSAVALAVPALTVTGGPEAALLAGLPPMQAAAQGDAAAEAADDDDYAAQMRQRARIARIHRPLGITTWSLMTATVVLGFIQYYNLYGFFAGQSSNPCAEGDAVFGRRQCIGTPTLHLTAAMLTTAAYSATFVLSFMMPDPGGLSEGDSDYARTLRKHKLLRWIHFGGMISQALLGVLVANAGILGLDRANDYRALRALATVHQVSGLITYGALTWAGALMVF